MTEEQACMEARVWISRLVREPNACYTEEEGGNGV